MALRHFQSPVSSLDKIEVVNNAQVRHRWKKITENKNEVAAVDMAVCSFKPVSLVNYSIQGMTRPP